MVRRSGRGLRLMTSAGDPSTDLPTMVGWLAILIAGGALVALSVRVLPYWPIEHKGTDLAVGVVMFPTGALLWAARWRVPAWTVHAGLLAGVGCITVAVWAVGPTAQTQAPALFYGFLSAFASAFLSRRIAMAYVALAGALYIGGLALDWRAEMATQWAMGMIAIALPCAVISSLVGQLRSLAVHDPLTGLANRRLLEQVLVTRMNGARRRDRPLSVAALDLDGLKTINDLAGHAAGDQLLIAAARGFAATLRAGDLLARVGGDEFIVLLPDADLSDAESAIQRMRARAAGVAFSAGVVAWNGETASELLQRADAALYAAKGAGGARTVADAPEAYAGAPQSSPGQPRREQRAS